VSFGDRAALYVYMGTHAPDAAAAAHFVLPLTTFAEQEGTFTNHENRVQRFWPAIEPPGSARPAWLVLGAMLAERTGGTPPTRAEAAFEAIPAFRGLTYETIGTRGAVVGSARRETAGMAGDD
jgi:predicted molibdopterin-dependent oxidoreductase YjgC